MMVARSPFRLIHFALLVLTATIFLLMLGATPVPRQPVHDMVYVIGMLLIYVWIALLAIQARRVEAPYRKPVFKPSLAKDLRRKNVLQVLFFTISLGTSTVAVVGVYQMLRAITQSIDAPTIPINYPGDLVFATVGCFLASVLSFTAGAAVHAMIAEARRAYHEQFMTGHQAPLAPAQQLYILSVHDKESRITNIAIFLIALGLASSNCIALVFGGSDLLYHDATDGLTSIGMFLLSFWGMLFGLVHLATSLPPKQTAAAQPTSVQTTGAEASPVPLPFTRGNVNRVIVLVIVFSLVGAIGTQYSALVFGQASPADEDLYIVREHAVVANSTTLPTTASFTCAIPSGGIDDIKVVLQGRAVAPCHLTASITCTSRFYNGTVPIGESYTRTSSEKAGCTSSTQSEASFSSTYSGFPVMQLDNITIGVTILSNLNNSDARVVITVYKMNDAIRLFLDRENVGFMCGATMFAGWLYVLFTISAFVARSRRRRAWQGEVLFRNPSVAGGTGTPVP